MFQSWWLEAVCAGKEWDVMLFKRSDISDKPSKNGSKDDEIVAVMPYLIRKRLWYRFILMPQMTQFGGVWLNSELHASPDLQEKLATLISKRLRAMHLAYYQQQFPVGNPMPYWLGKQRMKVEERVTYRIDDLGNIDEVEGAFSKNKQRQLHKAGELTVDYDMSAEEFFRFHTQCMKERGHKLTYSREFLLVLERKARRHEQVAIIRISGQLPTEDGQQNGQQPAEKGKQKRHQTLAAGLVVWDNRYLYYLIPAYLPSAAKSGASARLADEAIRLAQEKGLQFDFEGGNDEGIANHYRQFGSKTATYSSVSRLYRPSFALLLALQKLKEKYYR